MALEVELAPIDFPDATLEALIRETLDRPEDPINKFHLEFVTELDCTGADILDLNGMEYCVNLRMFRAGGNSISDVSPLAGLTSPEYISLSANSISDLSPLADLTNLTNLYLGYNDISDISPLTGLTNLQELNLNHNNISSIAHLVENAGLAAGDWVYLMDNPLSALSMSLYIPMLEARGVTVFY